MLVPEHPSCPLGHHVHVTVLAAAKTWVGILFWHPLVCVSIVMYYKKCIVLT
jgi:hypothetical protein